MNTSLLLDGSAWWQVAGWTMIHYLWLGTLVGALAAACRLLLRRAGPSVRYVAAVVALGILTALPIGIAAWLVSTGPASQVAAIAEGGADDAAGNHGQEGPSDVGRLPAGDVINLERANGEVVELSARRFVTLSDGKLSDIPEEMIDVLAAPRAATATDAQPQAGTQTARADQIRVNEILDAAVRYLPWLWIVGTPLTFALLATGLVGTRRMRSTSQLIEAGAIVDACRRIARSLGVRRQVAVAVCERIAAPVLVGILRPVILLPPAALLGWSPTDLEMVLLHELAHVRRWDNLVNLLQRLVESLLFFHPAVWLVSNWVRREREACCDAIVVGHTHEPRAYAELLVSIAARLPHGALFAPAAASAMAAGPLRSRIRQILKLEDDPMLVSGKSLALATLVLLVVVPLSAMQLAVGGRADDSATASVAQVADDSAIRNDIGPADGAKEVEALGPASVDAENAMLQLLFEVSDDNPLQTKTYDVPEQGRERDRFLHLLQGWQHDRFGPRLKFSTQLTMDNSRVEIHAAQAAHEAIFAHLSNEFQAPIPDAASIVTKTKAQLDALMPSLPLGKKAEIDLLLRQISDLQKLNSELQSKVLQTRTDYAAALAQLNELKDPNGEQKRTLRAMYRIQFKSQASQAAKSQSMLIETIATLEGILGNATLLAEQARPASSDTQELAQEPKRAARPLAEAVREFNARAQSDPIGRTQPPLTEEELIAAIRGWMRDRFPVPDEDYARYEKIAETRIFPPEATLEFTTIWEMATQRFDVWWIDLVLKSEPEGGYGFRIRDIKLRSRPLTPEEIAANAQIIRKPFADAGLAEWENLVALEPRMDAVALKQAWDKLGLKLVPRTANWNAVPEAISALHGVPKGGGPPVDMAECQYLTIVGGNLPPGLPQKSALLTLGDQPVRDTDDLFTLVGKGPTATLQCIVLANGQKYVFTTQPPLAAPSKPQTTTPPELDLARSQIRLENNQIEINLTDAQSQSQTRSRLVSSIDVLAPSATVRMNGNQITIYGVDDKSLLQIKHLILVAFGSGKLNLGGSTGEMGNVAPVTNGLGSAPTSAQNALGSGATRGRPGFGLPSTPAAADDSRADSPAKTEPAATRSGAARIQIREQGQQLIFIAADANVLKEVEAMVPMISGSTRVVAGNGELVISNSDPAKLAQIRDFLMQTFNRQATPSLARQPAPAATKTPAAADAADKDQRAPDRAAPPARDSREVLRYEGNLVEPLLEWSRDEAFQPMRMSILTALAKHHQQTPDKQIEERLAEALADKDAEVVRLATQLLYPIRYPPRSGRGSRGAAGGGRGGRGSGLNFGSPQLPETAEFRPQLVEALKSSERSTRLNTLLILKALGPKAKQALPHVLPLLLDDVNLEEKAIGFNAMQTIRAITSEADEEKLVNEYVAQIVARGEPAKDVEKAQLLQRFMEGLAAERNKEE